MDAVCTDLKAEQRALAEEVERLFRVFDERLRALAERTHELSPEALIGEAKMISEAQDGLRRVLRRFDATAKSTEELEQELGEWQQREEDSPLHADHPSIRAEIVHSELVCRGLLVTKVENPLSQTESFVEEIVEEAEEEEVSTETFLLAIRDAAREAERWHSVPALELDHEVLDQVRHLRELHAHLKGLDRKQGITRDRLVYAVNPRECS